jgi:hypothetical protein
MMKLQEKDGHPIFSTHKKSVKLPASLTDQFNSSDIIRKIFPEKLKRSPEIYQCWDYAK